MANMADARFQSCERRIRDALAELLRTKSLTDISVSELAREAHVSRATFYMHHDNVGDAYEELVREAMADVRTFDEQFSCGEAGCRGEGKLRYCERVRTEERFKGVVREARFFPSMMDLTWEDSESNATAKGIDQAAMRALRLFQMSGCHAVATSELAERSDWERIRRIIDAFIEGGLRAVEGMR